MAPLDATSHETNDEDPVATTATATGLVAAYVRINQHSTLTRGIVWADILGAITADEQVRQRDAAEECAFRAT